MIQMGISFFFDVIVSFLLVLLLFYAVRLNRHILIFTLYRKEFEKLFKEFIDSTKRAEIILKEIKLKSLTNAKDVQETLARGQYLVDDLEFLLRKSSETIEILEKLNRPEKGRDFIDPALPSRELKARELKSRESNTSLLSALDGLTPSEEDARNFLKTLQAEELLSENDEPLILDEKEDALLKGLRKVR